MLLLVAIAKRQCCPLYIHAW